MGRRAPEVAALAGGGGARGPPVAESGACEPDSPSEPQYTAYVVFVSAVCRWPGSQGRRGFSPRSPSAQEQEVRGSTPRRL